ncbi:hypothetical protein HY642_00555 [Candidatus Woesearchaeota archaeon]|nr:hypothetical protein [Candidatus Woesearchaeota archaeon]
MPSSKPPSKARIRAVVNKHDPICLLKLGCPKDEYDPEVELLVRHVIAAKTTSELRDKVHAVFVRMFDAKIAGSKARYYALSKDLFRNV